MNLLLILLIPQILLYDILAQMYLFLLMLIVLLANLLLPQMQPHEQQSLFYRKLFRIL